MEHHQNRYAIDLPYPEVVSTGEDVQDIKLIFPLYGGAVGELTAVTQYAYQHFILNKLNPHVAESLMGIAIVEMHHLGYLGEAIKTLGGVPKYMNPQKCNYWDGSLVFYQEDICKGLLNDLKIETEAYEGYIKTAKRVKNPTLSALLERIAMDEKHHIELFTQLIQENCRKNNYC